MTVGPRAPVVELDAMAHQHLREPVTCAHQIQPQRLPGANEITQRFLLRARDADRVQLAGEQQPDEMLGVTPIGLDLVSGRARDLRRRRDHALHAPLRELRASTYPVGPASYATLTGRGRPAQNPAAARTSPFIANAFNSPVSASSTAATIFAACTSKPTRVLAFAMAGSSYPVVGRRAGSSRAA
jgi:hypothetical protein